MKMVLSQNYCCGPCLILFRKLYIYSVLRTNHYKVLGLSPTATQSEIKSAYYELSKKHHPDKNQGSEASARMFRNITAAYEILGNEKLRKKYDETHRFNVGGEFNSFGASQRGDYNDDVERMYYERRQRQFSRRYYYGKTPYYDFDTWYKAHYGRKTFDDAWVVKNASYTFKRWDKSQFQRSESFKQKGDSYGKSYKQSTEAIKKRDTFINNTEQALLIAFYLAFFLALFFKL